MPQFVFANNVQTTFASAVGSSATTITLSSAANIPAIPPGSVWAVTLNDQATETFFEIVYATANLGGGQLQVLRGQEGTTARAWNVGDFAYAADTAGILSSFINASQAANFVQLQNTLSSPQTGSIVITGSVNAAAAGVFGTGVSVGGPLVAATTGGFSGDVTALDFLASRAYTNTGIGLLALRFNGPGTVIGVGPSSGLSTQGVTASALAIGPNNGSGLFVAIDINGNIGTPGAVNASFGSFTNQIAAPTVYQNSIQVVSTITSSSLILTRTASNYNIEVSTAELGIGMRFPNLGNGGSPTISLPNYGTWFIEVFYGLQETSNTNMTIALSISGGTITNQWLSNANGHTAFNAQCIMQIYGRGYTTVNNQTITFALTTSGGALDPSNQPWTVWATRLT